MSEPFEISKKQFEELMALKKKMEGNAGGENFAEKGLTSIGSAAQSGVDLRREMFEYGKVQTAGVFRALPFLFLGALLFVIGLPVVAVLLTMIHR